MSTKLSFTLALLVLPALPGSAHGQSDAGDTAPAMLLTTRSIRGLGGRAEAVTPLPLWSFLNSGEGAHRADLLGGPGDEAGAALLEQDVIIELTRIALGDAVAEDDLQIEAYEGNHLLLVGDGRDTKAALDALASIESVVARRIGVRARLYDWSGRGAPPTVATAEELASLTADLEPKWSGVAWTRAGVPVSLGQHRTVRYVRAYRNEIGADAHLRIPELGAAFEGIGLTVKPHTLIASSDLAVFCQLAVGEQIARHRHNADGDETPPLDAPVVAIDAATMSGRIPNGGALLYTASSAPGAGSNLMLAVSCELEGEVSKTPIRIIPVALLASPYLRHAPLAGDSDAAEDDNLLRRHRVKDTEAAPFLDAAKLVDLVRTFVEPATWDIDAHIVQAGPWIFVQNRPQVGDEVEKLLLGLQNRLIRTHDVQLTTAAAHAGNSTPLHTVRFPTMVGRHQLVIHGLETTAIRSIKPEVSARVAVATQIVSEAFDGIYAEVHPYRSGARSSVRAAIDLVHGTAQTRRLGAKQGGEVDTSTIAFGHFRHDGTIEPGTTIALGEGPPVPLDGATCRTTQTLRVQ